MINNIQKELEKIYIIQPITEQNASKCRVLQEEAVSLIESAGAVYAGTIYQNVREINPATFVGEGKLRELNERLEGLDGITILFNGELSPSQTLNISAALDNRKVIDRTTLILDIFAKNAQSSEGKLQVELAQLKYIYPRLKGKGEALSRLGGGVGTRGPGETQLETDRRYIRGRLKYLEDKLKETEKRRSLQTKRRKKKRSQNNRSRRLYQYGKINFDEPFNRLERIRQKRTFCYARSHGQNVFHRRCGISARRYGRFFARFAPQSYRGIQIDFGKCLELRSGAHRMRRYGRI